MSRLLAQLMGGLYRDQAGEGEDGGTPGGGAAQGTPAAGSGAGAGEGGSPDAKGAAPDAGGAAAAGGTGAKGGIIEEAKRAAQGAAPSAVPEKFIVKNAAGEIDHAATAAKAAAGALELEKRLGTAGGLPPAKADDYKLELREGEKELPKVDDKVNKAFREKALAMGLNQKQYNEMVRAGNEIIGGILGDAKGQSAAEARAVLVTHYGGEKQYQKAIGDAYRGFAAFADETDLAEIDSIGDFPVFIRVFERIARELREDQVPNFNAGAAQNEAAEVAKLQGDMKSDYWNDKAPGHQAAVQRVAAYHEKMAAQANSKFKAA